MKKMFFVWGKNRFTENVSIIARFYMSNDAKTMKRFESQFFEGCGNEFVKLEEMTLQQVKEIPDHLVIYEFNATSKILMQHKIKKAEVLKLLKKKS